jgi:hypothetical protein
MSAILKIIVPGFIKRLIASAQEDNKTVETTQGENSVSGLKYKTASPERDTA